MPDTNPPTQSTDIDRSHASWIFGGVFTLFLMGVFIFAPDVLPEFKQRMLALFCALTAGLFEFFLVGDLSATTKSMKTRFGRMALKSSGGMALFLLVLVWWLSPLAPVATKMDATDAKGNQKENAIDMLLVVDCLLPGETKQFNNDAFFKTQPYPKKLAAIECAKRGGKYTPYHDTTRVSALKVWLPFAERGDPEAQNNVGEIFEKGMGEPPEYEKAKQW